MSIKNELTNEELAQRIQSGNKNLYAQLWQQTERFFKKQTYCYYVRRRESFAFAGVEIDDMLQACFFALMDAVQAFDSSTGYKLLTYTAYPLKNRFNELLGTRAANKRVPLNESICIDSLMSDADGVTIGDTIEDETSELEFEVFENAADNEQLKAAIKQACLALTDKERAVLELHYCRSFTINQLEEVYPGAGAAKRSALRKLRNSENSKPLRKFADEIMRSELSHNIWNFGTSEHCFREKQGSSTELAFEYVERNIAALLSGKGQKKP